MDQVNFVESLEARNLAIKRTSQTLGLVTFDPPGWQDEIPKCQEIRNAYITNNCDR